MSARLMKLQKSRLFFLFVCIAWPALAQSQAPSALTNAAQVRNLSVAEATRALPVHLQGVVLADSAGGNSLVIQDDSEAIYMTGAPGIVSKYRRGDLIEITGVTDPGGFAPIVVIRNCKKTGTAPLPEPRRVIFDDLMRKHFDAQFVEITGVVRS
jgi:hypothetical protein